MKDKICDSGKPFVGSLSTGARAQPNKALINGKAISARLNAAPPTVGPVQPVCEKHDDVGAPRYPEDSKKIFKQHGLKL